ncbi:helix-turn-helix transcriptional regulator [Mucilaginibacter segetis]|uniref:LuxR family transcriptional regulator n=1 Tax=Mucilaginibacter segetis TaxID=2793071 RepID=A0A934PVB0_9SPHI|nr:helix-turn-helix transcriptional regulator [Mucilaginibacter segetis]MBK0380070.1 LuxR family transcriptional regulator [Mucilaginibacter segetis]
MLVFGTQIHIVTAIFIGLEILMFIFQLASYFYWPKDKNREWYLLLLFLMLLYNITGGLFPDPLIKIPINIQEMIAYGTGFLMASYFPFYFYKAFELKTLRWHALFGVPLFLILPYIIFFVIIYAINGELNVDIRFGMIVPFIYAIVLLWVIFWAIRHKYKTERDKNQYLEEIAMHCAVTPWLALAFFGLVEESQLIEVLCTNTGIIVITALFIARSVSNARQEFKKKIHEVNIEGIKPDEFLANCLHYGLTRTEILIVQKIYKGMRNSDIANNMFISEETVKKHIQNTFRKTNVQNRATLIHKLQNHHK